MFYQKSAYKTIEAQAKECFSYKKETFLAFGEVILLRVCQLKCIWEALCSPCLPE